MLIDMRDKIISYLEEEKKRNEMVLIGYQDPIPDSSEAIRMKREYERMRLVQYILDLSRLIDGIKMMFPNE